ncbi:MAG: DUF4974 domain-containing protein [Marinilabiliales bacterium]|nr:DUF4974 domain-containing protein [Marinilabiliales bacterium]
MSYEILEKILDGSATDSEKQDFFNALELDPALREEYLKCKNLDFLASATKTSDPAEAERHFARFWELVSPRRKRSLVPIVLQYAAIVLFALISGFLIRDYTAPKPKPLVFSQHIVYSAEKGAVSAIHLEDGSVIWLSTGSKIAITKKSTGEMKAVLNGEAYFDMVRDPRRNFVIDLGYFQARDIGTKFDVRAYGEEKSINLSIVEGQVDFSKSDNLPVASLKPGDYLHFDKMTQSHHLSKQDPTIATAWKEGKFVFIHRTLADICHELESWYNVQIIISNQKLANTRYTSVIKRTTTVKLVLNMLSLTDRINYTITDRKEAKDIVYIY